MQGIRLEDTRIYQDAKAEGELKGALFIVLRLLARRVGDISLELKAQIEALPLIQIENLAEAALDFLEPTDLVNWLQNPQEMERRESEMPTKSYDDLLINSLMNPEDAAHYLTASLEITLEDGNYAVFLSALHNVCLACEKAGMTNVPFQELETLNEENNGVDLLSLDRILTQVGITIDVKPVEPLTLA